MVFPLERAGERAESCCFPRDRERFANPYFIRRVENTATMYRCLKSIHQLFFAFLIIFGFFIYIFFDFLFEIVFISTKQNGNA